MNAEYQFKDTKFLSAQSKKRILKAWIRFLKSRFSYHNFTNDLYNHLHLHCAFIAHYDRHGFHQTYFVDPEDTIKFLRQFDEDFDLRSVEYGDSCWHKGEHEDLNSAMISEFKLVKAEIYREINNERLKNKQAQAKLVQEELALLQQQIQ